VGIHRYRVTVEGKPNHAGTTPMNMRFDALAGAAELVLALERICREPFAEQVVGTIGKLNVEPNGANVIPGRVAFELEVRSLDTAILEEIMRRFSEIARGTGQSRMLCVHLDCLSKSEAIRVSPEVQDVIAEACRQTGSTSFLPSGAGHDANQLARIAPIGMIFVPSKDGRSHCPEEWTSFDEIALGVKALGRALLRFDLLLPS
jgi:N-carbamoyl-L-amino-acid hydrolase